MNLYKSNRVESVISWRIHVRGSGNERSTAVAIKIVRNKGSGKSDLPAQWSRPRCWQKTRETVESTPRQFGLINA